MRFHEFSDSHNSLVRKKASDVHKTIFFLKAKEKAYEL